MPLDVRKRVAADVIAVVSDPKIATQIVNTGRSPARRTRRIGRDVEASNHSAASALARNGTAAMTASTAAS
jgi:hypothetical protein